MKKKLEGREGRYTKSRYERKIKIERKRKKLGEKGNMKDEKEKEKEL